MKITVITGSPRKNGNTFAMVDSFIKAAEAKGHEVVEAGEGEEGFLHPDCLKCGRCEADCPLKVPVMTA